MGRHGLFGGYEKRDLTLKLYTYSGFRILRAVDVFLLKCL